MSSPGQKRGSCGHAMAAFDGHAFCARCRDKKKGEDPCVKAPESECKFCIVLTPDQVAQLSTPSYRLKKEKREAKKMEATPSKDSTLVDPSSVAVIGPVSASATVSSPTPAVPEKKVKKDKPASSNLRNLLIRRSRTPSMKNWIKNGPTASIDWKFFSWLSRYNLLNNRPSQLQ